MAADGLVLGVDFNHLLEETMIGDYQ